MARIGILGAGNVATHLLEAFETLTDTEIVQVVGRNAKALKRFGNSGIGNSSDFENIANADIYVIAVSDDAISEVSRFLKNKEGLVVHTSGSVSMEALSQHPRRGVFYPLQTFSRERKTDMKSVPICLEAQKDDDLIVLKQLAGQLSCEVYEVDSQQRKSLHLAAVFVNNFTNHLYHIGKDICGKNGLPFEILHPLIRETVDKITVISPFEAQTGPARRGDSETIKNHIGQLKDSDYSKLYDVLSESILNLYR